MAYPPVSEANQTLVELTLQAEEDVGMEVVDLVVVAGPEWKRWEVSEILAPLLKSEQTGTVRRQLAAQAADAELALLLAEQEIFDEVVVQRWLAWHSLLMVMVEEELMTR